MLGCGVEVQGKAAKELSQFDLNNLRWSKVVICTDGDVDGFQIRTLILTMLYRLCPTLIREGYVYIAETPLFEITYREKNADKTWFAYSEKEKADIVRQLEGKKFTVQRSKGLGENDPEMMWLTTMNPETRRLVQCACPTTRRRPPGCSTCCWGTTWPGGRTISPKTATCTWI